MTAEMLLCCVFASHGACRSFSHMLCCCDSAFLSHETGCDYSERPVAFSREDLVVWMVNSELAVLPSLFVDVVRLDQSQL